MIDNSVMYGIEYNTYIGGGSPKRKLAKMTSEYEVYHTEKAMADRAFELKSDYLIGDIELFVVELNKIPYEFNANNEVK